MSAFLLLALGVVVYLIVVRYFRFKRVNSYEPLDHLSGFDRIKAASSIVNQMAFYEFPFVNSFSLEFGLFRTYAIPSISKILVGTKQFAPQNIGKRVDDTDFLIREMLSCPVQLYDETEKRLEELSRGERAIKRLNLIHSAYPIKNHEMLYVLSIFVLEPIRWLDRFGWRKTVKLEQQSIFEMWIHYGQLMGIKDLPKNLEEMDEFNIDYEKEHLVFDKNNVNLRVQTIGLFLNQFPSVLHPVIKPFMFSVMDDRLSKAMGIPPADPYLKTILHGCLTAHAWVSRYLLLPRIWPMDRIAKDADKNGFYKPLFNKFGVVYPNGYKIEELGPSKFPPGELMSKCPRYR